MNGSNIVTGTLYREDLQEIEKVFKKDWRIIVYGQTFAHKILPEIKKTGCIESDAKRISLEAVEYGYLLGRECLERYPESVEVVCRENWLKAFAKAKNGDFTKGSEPNESEIAREFAEKMSALCAIVVHDGERNLDNQLDFIEKEFLRYAQDLNQ